MLKLCLGEMVEFKAPVCEWGCRCSVEMVWSMVFLMPNYRGAAYRGS